MAHLQISLDQIKPFDPRESIARRSRLFGGNQSLELNEKIRDLEARLAKEIERRSAAEAKIIEIRKRPDATMHAIDGYAASIHRIRLEVCEKHGVSESDIASSPRPTKLTRARAELWWRLQNEVGMSSLEMARLTKKGHTSVLSGIEMHIRRMKMAAVDACIDAAIEK